MPITIAYISARPDNRIDWFFDSLARNNYLEHVSQIIFVDKYAEAYDGWTDRNVSMNRISVAKAAGKFAPILTHVPPKPCVWSGKHRLTPRDWWSASSYRNTALCHCRNSFIAFLDDRCVLEPTWMDGVYEAFQKNYVVCGTYEKRTGMVVRDGQIIDGGKTIGTDSRMTGMEGQNFKRQAPGAWVFGCTFALPVEWMLQVNGFDESWDSVSMEDVHFGRMLENNSFPIFFDSRMKMIEDRSGTEIYPKNREHDMKRSSKERHPHDKNDKTHKLIDMLWGNKRSAHAWDLTTIRNNILSGKSYPIPRQPTHDFFDSQPLIEMT